MIQDNLNVIGVSGAVEVILGGSLAEPSHHSRLVMDEITCTLSRAQLDFD